MNIVFVAHGGLTSQSTYHVISIAEKLTSFGHQCVICIPTEIRPQDKNILTTSIPFISFEKAKANDILFLNGSTPDLIHVWTPRENVKNITLHLAQKYNCPYFVHLEDNEREILNRELNSITYEELAILPENEQDKYIVNKEIRIHPAKHWEFLKKAAGCTVLIERLKEHVPTGIPVQLFWPSYDSFFSKDLHHQKEQLREKYGIDKNSFVVLYSGAFHEINLDEVSRMVAVLKVLAMRGMPLTFVKTGSNTFPSLLESGIEQGWIKDLGFLPREELCSVLALSDILIQPGNSDPFNDYRFPSKLPEAMIQKLPIILPASNLGEVLIDGEEAIITHDGSMEELKQKIISLFEHPEQREKIAIAACRFAKEKLSWESSAKIIETFYKNCLSKSPQELKQEGILQENETDNLKTTSTPAGENLHARLATPIGPAEIVKSMSLKKNQEAMMFPETQNKEESLFWEKRYKKKKRRYNRLSIAFYVLLAVMAFLIVALTLR